MSNWKISRVGAAARALLGRRANAGMAQSKASGGAKTLVGSAWNAWRAGDFAHARARADLAIQRGEKVDEARHVLALAAPVAGQHADAITAYSGITARYRRLSELDEPILWTLDFDRGIYLFHDASATR